MREVRQTITPALKAMARMMNPHRGTSGVCHLWFDDGNYERQHVAWIASVARKDSPYHRDPDRNALGFYLARIGALYLTDTQRRKLAGCAWATDRGDTE